MVKRWTALYERTIAEAGRGEYVLHADVVAMVREVMEKYLANKLDGKFPLWEILRRLGEEP